MGLGLHPLAHHHLPRGEIQLAAIGRQLGLQTGQAGDSAAGLEPGTPSDFAEGLAEEPAQALDLGVDLAPLGLARQTSHPQLECRHFLCPHSMLHLVPPRFCRNTAQVERL